MTILFATHEAYLDHVVGPAHPERPERLGAVIDGARAAGLGEALVPVVVRPASMEHLARVHTSEHIERIRDLSERGGGRVDEDTVVSPGSWNAALLAAGAGLTVVDELISSGAKAAFCAVRPPGHHATRRTAMGFCLMSNVAVTAAELASRGERVLVVDFDVHHGNGTQDIFYEDGRVMFVSLHQWPLYPGTGWYDETGSGSGVGTTLNIPLPPGTTGDAYMTAFDDVLAPMAASFSPTWLIVSAGFDAHRRDPLSQMGLSAGDYALMIGRLMSLVPEGRVVLMLEGGYDLDALEMCTTATLQAVLDAGRSAVERPTSGGTDAALQRVTDVKTHLRTAGFLERN